MSQSWAKAFYASAEWLACRAAYIASVFHLCERCHEPGEDVHHKIRLTPENINDPDITLNHDNLIYLCKKCHNKAHGLFSEVTRDDVTFDEQGNLVKKTN